MSTKVYMHVQITFGVYVCSNHFWCICMFKSQGVYACSNHFWIVCMFTSLLVYMYVQITRCVCMFKSFSLFLATRQYSYKDAHAHNTSIYLHTRQHMHACIHTHTHTRMHARSGVRQLSSNVWRERHVLALKALRSHWRPQRALWSVPLRT